MIEVTFNQFLNRMEERDGKEGTEELFTFHPFLPFHPVFLI